MRGAAGERGGVVSVAILIKTSDTVRPPFEERQESISKDRTVHAEDPGLANSVGPQATHDVLPWVAWNVFTGLPPSKVEDWVEIGPFLPSSLGGGTMLRRSASTPLASDAGSRMQDWLGFCVLCVRVVMIECMGRIVKRQELGWQV
jgi:hypothetical protein